MDTTEIITNPEREVDEKTLEIIKTVFEEQKHIQFITLYNKGNDVFGVFIHSIKDSLSFLKVADYTEQHITMGLENVNINFFELGALLYHIYFTGAINFIELLLPPTNIIKPSSNYNKLCDILTENIPFNIYKAKLLDKDIKKLTNDELAYLRDQIVVGMEYIEKYTDHQKFIEALGPKKDELFLGNIISDNDRVRVFNQINDFINSLKVVVFDKISEKKINDIDELYKKIRLKFK